MIDHTTSTGRVARWTALVVMLVCAAGFAVHEPAKYTVILICLLAGGLVIVFRRPPAVETALASAVTVVVAYPTSLYANHSISALLAGIAASLVAVLLFARRGRVRMPAGLGYLLCLIAVTAAADSGGTALRALGYPALVAIAAYIASANVDPARILRFIVYLVIAEVGVAVLQTDGLSPRWDHLEPGAGTSVYANQIFTGDR